MQGGLTVTAGLSLVIAFSVVATVLTVSISMPIPGCAHTSKNTVRNRGPNFGPNLRFAAGTMTAHMPLAFEPATRALKVPRDPLEGDQEGTCGAEALHGLAAHCYSCRVANR